MSRGGRDRIDRLIDEWASVRRELLGYATPKLAKQYVGALRCTLAARRDLHAGSRSGKIDQAWPEFPYQGDAAVINVVFHSLTEPLQEIMDAHYVATTPRSKSARADLMGLSVRVYWDRVNRARASVEGALAIVESVRTHSALGRGISRIPVTPSGSKLTPA